VDDQVSLDQAMDQFQAKILAMMQVHLVSLLKREENHLVVAAL
jgi:hypothetical protein